MEHRGSHRERVCHMFCMVTPGIEDAAAVVVAESVWWPYLGDCLHNCKHPLDRLVKAGGNLDCVSQTKQSCMHQEIEGVDVVVQRLLEIDSIRSNLAPGFLLKDDPTLRFPFACGRNLRAERPDEEERNRFAQQMSVRRKICG